jgi:dTMP kinase
MPELGKYIVIEGHDGTGKTEQAKRLRERLKKMGVKVCNFLVEEPDGATTEDGVSLVPIATEIRKIIKNGSLERDPYVNVQLFTAARRANWLQAMEPALDRGEWVVTARNWWSTIAYQGSAEGVPYDVIENTYTMSVGDSRYMNPDLGLILDVDHATRNKRIAKRGNLENPDTFESRDETFQQRIKQGYLKWADLRNIPVINASGTLDEVETAIWHHVEPLLDT